MGVIEETLVSPDVSETVREDGEFVLLRERRGGQSPPRLVLALKTEHPPAASLKRLEHECALAPHLDPAWAVRPVALALRRGQRVLEFDDPGGETLDRRLGQPLDLTAFFPLAIGIAEALGHCHARGIIHKDLKPSNILVDESGVVRLTGFGFASRLPRERLASLPPEIIAGTLAYMAPEQTGRMNRSVDSRSDLYSLGVTFYEMLTGTLPFAATDPLEWIHCHIARAPTPLEEYVQLPGPLVGIVTRLLAKTAEERYQTATGLVADLCRCRTAWETDGRIGAFAVGGHDASGRLLIPEKLYGREAAIATLLAAFDRVATNGATSLVLVSGFSGIGKSSVVQELHKALVPCRGLYATGKFDQYKRDIPFRTLVQAFQGLIRQLLSKSDSEIAPWREDLQSALGRNGQLMVNMIPELELIIGKQPPVADVPPQEIPNRFRLLFQRFLEVFARPEHPLVLFLDDLQWLDAATLDLLHYLMTDTGMHHVLVIGAYRDNEVDSLHPLARTLDAIRKSGADVEEIALSPLSLADIGKLIADVLHCGSEHASPLARLVYDKTGGNPFFTIQFLTALEDEGLLTYDHDSTAWRWDLARIRAKDPSDNVARLVSARLNHLPSATLDVLKHLACLGNLTKTATLAMVLGASEETILAHLWEAEYTGLIVRLDDSYKFLHDRMQEAAYALIAEGDRAQTHLRIGRSLWSGTAQADIETKIFEIVAQLNRGAALITSPDERRRVAELNLIAGKKARQSTAYAAALDYLMMGDRLLTEDRWSQSYDLAFALEYHRCECEFLTGALSMAEERLSCLSGRTKNPIDDAAVTCLQAALYQALDRNDRAVEAGLGYLRRVGIFWSATPTMDEVRREYEVLWRLLAAHPIETIIDLPLMSDRNQRATLDVLTSIQAPVLLTNSVLFRLLVCRMANISLEHGNSDSSCVAYAQLALIFREELGDYQAALRIGRLGLDLAERLDRYKNRIYQNFGNSCSNWSEHFRKGLPFVRRAYTIAQEAGDVVFACYASYIALPHLLALGAPLEEVQQEAENTLAFARKLGFNQIIASVTSHLWFIRAMRGEVKDVTRFDDEQLDAERYERELREDSRLRSPACWYWLRKLQAFYLANNYAAAAECASHAETLLWMSLGIFEEADFHFYAALARAALCDEVSKEERPLYRDMLAAHARWLDNAAEHNPESLTDRASLVAAEIARLDDRELEAQRLYERAISAARTNGFVQNEAVAREAAARFYDTRGLETIARDLLRGARACYLSWGARAKAQQLDRCHKNLLWESPLQKPGTTIDAPVTQLDVETAVKAAQALSSEIVLDKLVETLLAVTLKHASADRGVLVLLRDDEPHVEAEATSRQNRIDVTVRRSKATAHDLPETILRYVIRTRTNVILDDAAASEFFSTDAYLRQRHPRSVLCLPLLRQQTLVGALYLENTLTSHVFSAARISLLEVVASQAAISLENARLYADLSEREGRIRSLVDSSLIGIFFWNTVNGITGANDAFLEIIGYSREDLVSGRIQWMEITPPEYQPMDMRYLEEVESGASPHMPAYERDFIRKNGTRIPTLCGGTLLASSRENGVSFVLDLTERRQAEAEREARQVADAANKAKSAFLANMSHELRTPLNSILGFSSMLRKESQLPEYERSSLDIIIRSGKHLLDLINDILDVSKIEAGRMQLADSPFDLGAMVRDVAEMMQMRAVEKGLQLLVDHSSTFPRYIHGDERRLRQVLINLIGNAVKFTETGGVTLRLGTRQDASPHLMIEVEDTGPGIAPEDQQRIFEPFVQLAAVEDNKGTGLGLTITRQIVQMMKGTLALESTLGKGSLFLVEIPLRPVPESEIRAIHHADERDVIGLAPNQPDWRVLIVEDQRDNQLFLVEVMKSAGIPVKTADNGKQAVELFESWSPHLIWMDHRLPVMDGIEATKIIRTLPGGDRVKIVAVTASAFQEQREELLTAGMDDLVRKPFRAQEIYDCLSRQLGVQYIYVTAK